MYLNCIFYIYWWSTFYICYFATNQKFMLEFKGLFASSAHIVFAAVPLLSGSILYLCPFAKLDYSMFMFPEESSLLPVRHCTFIIL